MTCSCYVTDVDPRPFTTRNAWMLDIDGTEYEIDDGLNQLGQDGWELVAVQQLAQHGQGGGFLAYRQIFKRPVE